MNALLGLDEVVMPAAAFQTAARDILKTYGGGGPVNPYGLGDYPGGGAVIVAGGVFLTGAAISTLVGIYIFRHVKDEKNTFWKVIGYGGGILSFFSALGLVFTSVAAVTAALPVTEGK